MNQIIESLFARKSVRVFTEQEIPEEIVQVILQASTQAPTAGNQQLYTILRITDPVNKQRAGCSKTTAAGSIDHPPNGFIRFIYSIDYIY